MQLIVYQSNIVYHQNESRRFFSGSAAVYKIVIEQENKTALVIRNISTSIF